MPALSVTILTSRLNETLVPLFVTFTALELNITSSICRCRDNPLISLSRLRILTRINSLGLLELGMRFRVLNLLIFLHVSRLHLLS